MKRGRRIVNPDFWLTPRQVSERIGCHHNTVLNWINRDGLPAVKVGGSGYYRIRRSDLKRFLDEFYPGLKI